MKKYLHLPIPVRLLAARDTLVDAMLLVAELLGGIYNFGSETDRSKQG